MATTNSDNDDDDSSLAGADAFDKSWWIRSTLMTGVGQWLIDSVQRNDVNDLRELLSNSTVGTLTEKDVDKALYYAANGHASCIRVLYDKLSTAGKACYSMSRRNYGYFPLHKAAKRGYFDCVKVLIDECNFDPNQLNHENVTPLVSAIHNPSYGMEMVRYLMEEHGADPNRSSTLPDNNPLFIAVERNNLDLARLLLDYKANPDYIHAPMRRRVRPNGHDPEDDVSDDEDDSDSEDEDEEREEKKNKNEEVDPTKPNHTYIPLYFAVNRGNEDMARLLLKHGNGANPNLHREYQLADLYTYDRLYDPVLTDMAIRDGNARLLSLLLQHGAETARPPILWHGQTMLNDLLERPDSPPRNNINYKTKLTICRILVRHAKNSRSKAAAVYLQSALDNALIKKHTLSYEILLKAGVNPLLATYRAICEGRQDTVRLLVQDLKVVDPFLEASNKHNDGSDNPYFIDYDDKDDDDDDDDDVDDIIRKYRRAPPASLFHAAAREEDTDILEFFLEQWKDRYASSNGNKNADGDHPIHVICCDPKVSIQAVELLQARQAQTLSTVDGEQGLLPFHFASMYNCSLDVIYFLMRHCPDAALRCRKQTSSSTKQDTNASSTMSQGTTNHDSGNTSTSTSSPSTSSNDPAGADAGAASSSTVVSPPEGMSGVSMGENAYGAAKQPQGGRKQQRLKEKADCGPSKKKAKVSLD